MPIIVNKQLGLEKTIQYRLSIQADLNGFSFSIVNDVEGKCHFLFQSEYSLNYDDMDLFCRNTAKLLTTFPLLSKKFQTVDIIYNTHKFALIPQKLFKQEEAYFQVQKLFKIDEFDEIDTIEVPDQQMVIAFAVNSTFVNLIKSVQPEFRIVPSVYQIINNIALFEEHNKIFLQYHKEDVHIVVSEGARVMFCNSFPACHFNSVLYYAFLALKQVQLNQEQTTVYLSGNFREDDITNLTMYFPKVKYFRHPQTILGSSEIELKYSNLSFAI